MADRRERVILELVDGDFSSKMARDAAATALLNRELNNLDGVSVRANKSIGGASDGLEHFEKRTRSGGAEIDNYSGRLNVLRDVLVTIGPAAVPIGAVAIPAVLGLASGLTAAAAGAGVALLALHGFGDALKAIDKAQIEPTVENLRAMHTELQNLGPAGAQFAEFLNALEPTLRQLQMDARAGFLPGAQEGIESLLTKLPEVRRFIFDIGTELGRLSASAGESLAGPAFEKFFSYLSNEGAATLDSFAHALGNVTEGFASLLVAFAPLSTSFANGFEDMTRRFADWSAGLSKTQGFRDFVAYVQQETPQVLDLLGSLATSFVSILKAAAPVGNAVVPALSALAKVLGLIAESPIGPPLYTAAAAMIVLNRATQLTQRSMTLLGVSAGTASTKLATIGKTAGGILLVGTAVGALVDGMNRIDPTKLDQGIEALTRGEVTGDIQKVAESLGQLASNWNAVDLGEIVTAGGLFGDSSLDKFADNVDELDAKLANLVETGQAALAADTFQKITTLGERQGSSAEETAKRFDDYALALRNAAGAADDTAAPTERLSDATDVQGRVAKQTAAEIDGLAKAMQEQRDAALAGFDAETQYRQALKDAGEQAKKSDAGIRGNSDAALANRSALSGLAAAWNNQSDAVKNNTARFKDAKASFIDTATAMGVPIQKARDLAKAILDIPKSRVIAIKAETDPALRAIQKIKQEIAGIHDKDVRINAYVNLVNSANKLPNIPLPGESADGSTVPKTGLPYADRHLYLLADGEEVISNRHGQADRHRDLLKAINSNRLAGGGTAGIATYASTKDPLANLAAQFGNLFAGYAADLNQIHQLTLSQLKTAQDELTTRKDLLKQEVDRDKALTQATRDAMQSLSDAIAGRFSSFDSSTQTSFGADANGNLSFNHNMTPGADANFNTDGVYIGGVPTGAQSYDDFVKAGLNNANDPNAELAQIAQTQRYLLQLLQALSGLGASKALLAFAGQNFSLQQLANLVSQGGLGVSQANHLLNQGNALGQQAGDFTANVVYGAKLDEQIKAQRQVIKLQQDTVDAINDVERAIRGQSKKGGPGKSSGSGKGSQDQGSSRYADRNADGTTKSHVKSRVRAGAKGYIR